MPLNTVVETLSWRYGVFEMKKVEITTESWAPWHVLIPAPAPVEVNYPRIETHTMLLMIALCVAIAYILVLKLR